MTYTFVAIRCRISYRDKLSSFTKFRECFQGSWQLSLCVDQRARPSSFSLCWGQPGASDLQRRCDHHTLLFVPCHHLFSCNLGVRSSNSDSDMDPIQDFLKFLKTLLYSLSLTSWPLWSLVNNLSPKPESYIKFQILIVWLSRKDHWCLSQHTE